MSGDFNLDNETSKKDPLKEIVTKKTDTMSLLSGESYLYKPLESRRFK